MPRVRANGVDLEYESLGSEGDPAILLIMGFASPLTSWPDWLCRGLAEKGLRVIRFDNRDIGRSTHLTEAGAPDLQAMIARAMRGSCPPPPIRWTTWPPTRPVFWKRSGSAAPTSSAHRWAG